MHKIAKNPNNIWIVTTLVLLYMLATMWCYLCLYQPILPHADSVTSERIQANLSTIKSYIAKEELTPLSIADIRSYAINSKNPFYAYDGYGERFDYIRLDSKHFALRSYGGSHNTSQLLGPEEPGYITKELIPSIAPTYEFNQNFSPARFPVALLEGSDSANAIWFAKLFVDRQQLSKRLVVFDRKKNRYIIAPHDNIEEFLWLPSGYQIVYTASGSQRYRDGVFIWNLLDGNTLNLVDLTLQTGGHPISQSTPIWASLAGIDILGPDIYFFMVPRFGNSLNPELFYQRENLYAFRVGEDQKPNVTPEEFKKHPGHARQLLSTPPQQPELLRFHAADNEVQNQWLELPINENLEETLLAWQNFTESNSQSPLFAYALWFMSSFYGEAYEHFSRIKKNGHAHSLRAFGVELSQATYQFGLSPTYIQGFANFNFETLMSGEYLISSFLNLPKTAKISPE